MATNISKIKFKRDMKKALKGCAESQYSVAISYFSGTGVEQNLDKTFYWMKRSCNQGYSPAKTMLGALYYNGWGVSIDYKEAIYWLVRGRRNHGGYSQFLLGKIRRWGDGASQSLNKAMFWQKHAAAKEYKHAYYQMGRIYENSEYKGHDPKQAELLFKLGANAGSKYAQKYLATIYEFKRPTEKNKEKAETLYLKSAKQSYAPAYSCLGWFYIENKNYEKAHYWMSKGANSGNDHGQRGLGYMYRQGMWFKKNESKAIEWYIKSAKQNNLISQIQLFKIYIKKKNYSSAYYWCSLLAKSGHTEGLYNLGLFYMMGYGVSKNLTLALENFLKAAKQGHSKAQYNCGVFYRDGDGTEVDRKKSIHWFSKAANNSISHKNFRDHKASKVISGALSSN